MNNFDVLLGMKLGGGGGSSTLVEKTITANGTYNPADDNADGYSSVTANVPNTYTIADEGKVVSSGALTAQSSRNIDANGLYDTTLNNSVSVDVPNSYTVADEGKVVSSGALVSQTATTCDSNGTIDTTLNNSVVVDVPNTYTAGDEGKVVSSGALVSQSAYPSTIVTNGTYNTTLNNSVTVDVPTSGGDDVIFIDYDGAVVYSYSKTDFLALTELPANPTHSGLTAQGWNWSLADAKTQVTTYDKLIIGQNYVTDDGKTRLYVHITDDCLSPTVRLNANSNVSNFDVDWGDGTEHSSYTGGYYPSFSHTYSAVGDYVITIAVDTSTYYFRTPSSSSDRTYLFTNGTNTDDAVNKAYRRAVYKIELGANVANNTLRPGGIYNNGGCCDGLTGLETITIPNNIQDVGMYAFRYCYKLKGVVIPSGSTTVDTYAFYYNYGFAKVALPSTLTTLGAVAFQTCKSLLELTLPNNCRYIDNSVFGGCYSLRVITIPNSITVISNGMFSQCRSLYKIDIPSTVTQLVSYAFNECNSLTDVDLSHITTIGDYTFYSTNINEIPPNLSGTIGNSAFAYCNRLSDVTIPNGVTTIRTSAFYGCSTLSTIDIPSSVTTIESNCFGNDTQLTKITIHNVEGSISGAPWGATNATVVWTG